MLRLFYNGIKSSENDDKLEKCSLMFSNDAVFFNKEDNSPFSQEVASQFSVMEDKSKNEIYFFIERKSDFFETALECFIKKIKKEDAKLQKRIDNGVDAVAEHAKTQRKVYRKQIELASQALLQKPEAPKQKINEPLEDAEDMTLILPDPSDGQISEEKEIQSVHQEEDKTISFINYERGMYGTISTTSFSGTFWMNYTVQEEKSFSDIHNAITETSKLGFEIVSMDIKELLAKVENVEQFEDIDEILDGYNGKLFPELSDCIMNCVFAAGEKLEVVKCTVYKRLMSSLLTR